MTFHRLILSWFTVGSVLCQLGLAVNAQGQIPPYRFEHFRTRDGLNHNYVLAVLQDQQGFLWVGTDHGLNRYDGYAFTNVITSTPILSLVEDRHGMIWAGTDTHGLMRIDPATDTSTPFFHDPDDSTSLSQGQVYALYEDHSGKLWVGTSSGLDRFEGDRGTPGSSPGQGFTHFKHDPDDPRSLTMGAVRTIFEDQTGILWIATRSAGFREGRRADGGLSRFDPATASFISYTHHPEDPFSLIDNGVAVIHEDQRGTLYVGTCRNGLHRYDRTQDRFERLSAQATPPSRVYAPTGDPTDGDCDAVTILHEDAGGGFWVGTYSGGLNYFDAQGRRTHFEYDPADPYSLSANAVLTLYEDRQGTLWIGTFLGGLNKVVPNPERSFQPLTPEHNGQVAPFTQEVTSILEDQNGRVWMGTTTGELLVVNSITEPSLLAMISVRGANITGLYQDREGYIWAGTYEESGLLRIDPKTMEIVKNYTHDPDDPRSLSNNSLMQILEDAEGTLWVSTSYGLNRLDRATDTFTRYLPDADDPGSLPSAFIVPIYEDRQDTVWFGGVKIQNEKGGLSRYNRDQDRFTSNLETTSIVTMYEDARGQFWVGTWGEGLLLFDRNRGVVLASYTTADGLPNNIMGASRKTTGASCGF